jgi:ABC-2 type transport system permease protein
MKNILMLIRRETWENRSFWIVPLVVSALILIIAALGGLHAGDVGDLPWFKHAHDQSGMTELARAADHHAPDRAKVYGVTISIFTVIQLFALGIVVFFYLIDTLLTERKDRSILFWKSLPVSDAQVVLSKVLTALVVAPIFVLLTSAVTQLLFGFVWWARFGGTPLAEVLVPFDAGMWLQVQLGSFALVPAVILWYLPIAAYLLLVSVWARRNGFLWAVLPPIALLIFEGLLMRTEYVSDFLGRRFGGAFEIMAQGARDKDPNSLSDMLAQVGRVFAHPETWVGAAVAAAIIYGCIRFRRYRDDA